MFQTRHLLSNAALVSMALFTAATCGGSGDSERPAGWSEPTHGKDAQPDYDLLFSTDEVHTIEISIAPDDYELMEADLADILGEIGGGFPGGDSGPDTGPGLPMEAITACEGLAENDPCEFSVMDFSLEGTCQLSEDSSTLQCTPSGTPGDGGPGGAPGGGTDFLSRDPIYVPVELRHDGHTWWHVGMRYKGNSSLVGSYQAGNGKLAFRLDFDEFENEHPEIDDQRFYGFKKLTFASGWNDDSLIRDAYVSEVLRDRGIPAAHCAFYRVFVDVGDGPIYWGLYTMIEDPADNAFLDAQMGGHDGNLYKPEGTGADWSTFTQEGFVKKTNKDEADWSDVEAAFTALHADRTDADAWRGALEKTFDVDLFLSWLAVNTTIVNWDSYGQMAHNYYLYADPETAKLRWIPWDHNLAMTQGGFGGGAPAEGTEAVSEVFHTDVSDNWPLISFLVQDPLYKQRYREKLEHALGGLFDGESGPTRMRELHELIKPYVLGPEGEVSGYSHLSSEQAFLDSIDGAGGLVEHLHSRHARVREALDAQ